MQMQLQQLSSREANHKLQRQRSLINKCVNTGTDLLDALNRIGWTYDDLQYELNKRPQIRGSHYYTLDDFRRKPHSIPIVSFFSGAGGMDLGFEAAGYCHTVLIEKSELFCETLRLNRPEWPVIGPPLEMGDVSHTEEIARQLRKYIDQSPFEGVFIGGPPCQPFSIAANQRFSKSGANFKRVGFAHATIGNLLFDLIALIKKFRPVAFVIENVPGLLEIDGGEQIRRAYIELNTAGYKVEDPFLLMAADYYVPQRRVRAFIIGNRLGKNFARPKPAQSQMPCSLTFDLRIEDVQNHVTRNHSAESIRRYMQLDYGKRDPLGRVDRLNPLLPSKTVIAGGTSGGGRSHLHPYIPRTLSVRECARLQTFPDDYTFTGPVARQFTQVGNAVPPVLAAQIATQLYHSIFS